ncbi:uncharacterized protein N7482_004741 [Penicillium canariense]|uniref:Uncharacterized protein n=1 Tax=Penicillium canariense TaxID=189055 RepID=A0A9W9IAW7_9EURO|nr:uncharacterized protein N7482_004741 [Penicillium canariense]KAJ5169147.1 hypothetical protein N7482_004741 [Penicillium canariense]
MSAQSPHPPTPKGIRNHNTSTANNNNNRRLPKKNATPHTQKSTLLSTPPSSPPRNMSPAGIATDSSANVHSKKKPLRSGKKPQPRNTNGASPAPNHNGHRHTHSQSSLATPQVKDGAAAYAGPTFHASPAPSALPIPSFFSKSFPESDLAPTLETDSDNADMEPDLETTPSKPRAARAQPAAAEVKAQPSPLDFLFKAAVQARTPNSMSSPEVATRVRSPHTDSKVLPSNPNHTPGGMFPMDLENERARASPIGPSFAPSYQDRMNALRSASSPSQSSASAPAPDATTEDQRRIKTEQLKYMLLNPRPQNPPSSSASPPVQAQPGYYGPHRPNINSTVPHYATPMRTSSGPPATLSQGYSAGQQQPVHPTTTNAGRPSYPYSHANGSQPLRNTTSPLRREVPRVNGRSNGYHSNAHHSNGYHSNGYHSNGYHSNGYPSGHSSPTPYGNGHCAAPTASVSHPAVVSPQPQYTQAAFAMPTNSPSPSKSLDTKKMEDDLRRILKLDATQAPGPGIPSSGLQRSFAA